MTHRTTRQRLVLAVAIFLLGCQASPPPPEVAPTDLLAQAREAMERADYPAAVEWLRQLVSADPDNLEARYRLGVSASHLGQKEETIREFQWVLARAPEEAPESQHARQWLILAGVPVGQGGPREGAPPPEPDTSPGTRSLPSVSGRATRDGDGGRQPIPRLQLFLKGLPGGAARDEYHVVRTDQEGRYRFTNVLPGEYVLTDRTASQPTWRLKVALEPGQHLALDLDPGNSVRVRDDLPEGR